MIAFDPNEKCDVWLKEDDDKPAETRATFEARFLTTSERRTVRKLADQALIEWQKPQVEAEEKCIDLTTQALGILYVGWRNVAGRDGQILQFDLAAIADVLAPLEMLRMVWRGLARIRIEEYDRPLSTSPPASVPAASVVTAPPESNAGTGPTA